MANTATHEHQLPYADILPRLIESVCGALFALCDDEGRGVVDDRAIAARFLWLDKARPRGDDGHLFRSPIVDKSLRVRSESKLPSETRIGQLVLTSFRHVDEMMRRSKTSGVLLPSPLRIVVDLLTVPEEPASRAYAFATVRAYLMESMGLSTALNGMAANDGGSTITIADVEEAVGTVRTFINKRDNLSVPKTEPGRHFVYQLMAVSGFLNLRFASKEHRLNFLWMATQSQDKLLNPGGSSFEFRVSNDIGSVPQVSGLINQIWGVPLPIRGADTVFYGGLRFATDGGLMVALTGQPGSGKTSLGLFLAISLAPLGARTFFVTAEEAEEDLAFRLATLTPEYLRRLSHYNGNTSDWFRAFRMPSATVGERRCDLQDVLHQLKEFRQTAMRDDGGAKGSPLPCPLIVVLDGIQNYFLRDYQGKSKNDGSSKNNKWGLDEFISDCRKIGALVILTCADHKTELQALEYLSDMVIDLEYRYTDNLAVKPVRYLVLRKSRHQLSRPGAHVCHLSGSDGFRIAPQLSSQLDQHLTSKVQEPNKDYSIEMLNYPMNGNPEKLPRISHTDFRMDDGFLSIFDGSHILVHGRGSTGKAGFGLTLLASPRLRRDDSDVKLRGREKTLVVSFLYPESYYENLNKEILLNIAHQYDFDSWSHKIDVLHFTPGYLNPEDLLSKISARLVRADLDGEAFTGVLFDGLHNTFLQFPRLEENPMIWPMLYGMLRTRNLTVVSTHTTFSISNAGELESDEADLAFRRAKPLLHALVQASDFYLNIERNMVDDYEDVNDDKEECIELSVLSAFGQALPRGERYWHRERLIVYDYLPQLTLPMSLPRRTRTRSDDGHTPKPNTERDQDER